MTHTIDKTIEKARNISNTARAAIRVTHAEGNAAQDDALRHLEQR